MSRRDLMKMGGVALAGSAAARILTGCAAAVSENTVTAGSGTGTSVVDALCGVIPSETAGPYPAHDDSAVNVLRLAGVVRSDIRSSLNTGAYSGSAVATGLPLTLTLKLVKTTTSCTPLSGYAIYLWHCDINGKYSMYSSGITSQTYLRGVQETDSNGEVTFQTIFPGCYDGRMTHIHFEVYRSLGQAVDDANIVRTSQLTFPMVTNNAVYNNVSGYGTSKTNLAKISYATDNVFSDGTTYQMASVVSGDTTTGYVSTLQVGITG